EVPSSSLFSYGPMGQRNNRDPRIEGRRQPAVDDHARRPHALVVFLRGINVGGHRRFRPSTLAQALRRHDVVNIGAAGTFVVRRPGARTAFLPALRRPLPFAAEIAVCDARDLLRLEREAPFDASSCPPDLTRFVSILSRTATRRPSVPFSVPAEGEWFVR